MKYPVIVSLSVLALAGGSVGVARSQATPALRAMASAMPAMPSAMPAMPSAMPAMASAMPAMASAMPAMASAMPAMASAMPAMASAMPAMASAMPAMPAMAAAMRMSADNGFIHAVSQSNDAENEASRYALQSTKSAAVRDFASQMIADHSTANVQLQIAARNANAPLPQRDPAGKPIAGLQSLTGARLDAAYLTQQVAAHKAALDVLSSYVAKGKNMVLKTYASNQVPIVQAHLVKAQALLAALPPSAAPPATSASVAPIPAGGVPGTVNPNGGSLAPPTSPSPAGSGSPNPQPSVGIPSTPGPLASPNSAMSPRPAATGSARP